MSNKKVSFSLPIRVLAILLWLSACSQIQKEELVTPTNTNHIFPTPQAKFSCPVLNSGVTVHEGKTESETEQAILDYLNQGGSAERLQKEIKKLQDSGILAPSQVLTVDINGDGIKEIVLAINFSPLLTGGDYLGVHGDLYVYNCANGKYDVTQIVAGEFADTLKILAVENLLGSDAPEILISRRWTYLDSYYEFVEMYMRKEDGWVLSFKTYESPCGIQTELTNGSNGHKELIIMSKSDCPTGSGESLTGIKSTYEFENNGVKLIKEESFILP